MAWLQVTRPPRNLGRSPYGPSSSLVVRSGKCRGLSGCTGVWLSATAACTRSSSAASKTCQRSKKPESFSVPSRERLAVSAIGIPGEAPMPKLSMPWRWPSAPGRPWRAHPSLRPRRAGPSRSDYTERLAEAGIETSVGSRGDATNAMAESVIGLHKAEVIRHEGPWKDLDDVEFATLEWVDWFNHTRLLEPIGYVPPAELEEAYYAHSAATEAEEGLKQKSLR